MPDNTRVTIMLDNKIGKLLRTTQAKALRDQQKGISFSKIINEALAKHYKIKDYVYNT